MYLVYEAQYGETIAEFAEEEVAISWANRYMNDEIRLDDDILIVKTDEKSNDWDIIAYFCFKCRAIHKR